MRKTSFFSVALPQSHDSHWIDPNLQKGRGEDARDMYSTSTADEYHEDEYPTGEMTEPRHIGHRQGVNWDSDHLGIFGKERHIFVSASKRRNATKINWLHIKPGTKVEPHDVTQIFNGLRRAGYTEPMQWAALRDDDEQHRASGTSRRDRLFGPFAAQWDKFVAAKQGEPIVQPTAQTGPVVPPVARARIEPAKDMGSRLSANDPVQRNPVRKRSLTDLLLGRTSPEMQQSVQKSRGEDARTLTDRPGQNAASYTQDDYPTGTMVHHAYGISPSGDGPSELHRGVFGENRHILLEARKHPCNSPHIDWLHVKPKTRVTPRHVRQVFNGLYDAGFTGANMTWNAQHDDDEEDRPKGSSRRDRFFTPLADQWKKFVAAKQNAGGSDDA